MRCSIERPHADVAVIARHLLLLGPLECEEAGLDEDGIQLVNGPDLLAFVRVRRLVLVPDILEQEDEGLWLCVSCYLASNLEQLSLGLPQEDDEFSLFQVPGTPDHVDGGIRKGPLEVLHGSLGHETQVLELLHGDFGLLDGQWALVNEVDPLIWQEDFADRKSSVAASNVDSSDGLVRGN